MNWYKFHVRDYLVSTVHLDDAEDLAYRRLMDLYFLTEGPIQGPVEEIARRVKLDLDCVQPVLNQFFRKYEGKYVHDEIEEALVRRRRQLAACSAAGKIGGKRVRPSKTVELTTSVGRLTVA